MSQLKEWMESHPGWEVLSDSEDSGDDSQDEGGLYFTFIFACCTIVCFCSLRYYAFLATYFFSRARAVKPVGLSRKLSKTLNG